VVVVVVVDWEDELEAGEIAVVVVVFLVGVERWRGEEMDFFLPLRGRDLELGIPHTTYAKYPPMTSYAYVCAYFFDESDSPVVTAVTECRG